MTCGEDIGNPEKELSALCQVKGFRFRGVLEVVMPENYIAMFEVPDRAEAKKIISAARPMLQQGIDLIRSGQDFPEKQISLQDKAKSGKIHDVFYKKFVRAKDFYATDACVSCRKCVNACVLRNITLEDGKPVWGESCTHCMACICGCPVQAIEYGKKSQGKPRYWCGDYCP